MHNMMNTSSKTQKLYWRLCDLLKVSGTPIDLVRLTLTAYLLCKQSQLSNWVSYNDIIGDNELVSDDIKAMTREYLTEAEWEKVLPLIKEFTFDSFIEIAMILVEPDNRTSDASSPDSIIKLAERILDLELNDSVLDMCCGAGAFSMDVLNNTEVQTIDAVDINTYLMDILAIRSQLMEKPIVSIRNDAFALATFNKTYDKIFANYPFAYKLLKETGAVQQYLTTIEDCPRVTSRSSDWVFNTLIMGLLSKKGKAVAIMTNGSTWNIPDRSWRKYFIDRGWIEAIIALPESIFSFTNISTTLIVLSHGNDCVRMIDATDVFHSQRWNNYFDNSDLNLISDALSNDSSISCVVSNELIKDNEYYLYPTKYLINDIHFKNEVRFESVVKSIRLGTKLSAQNINEMLTEKRTDFYYLQMNNIQSGIVDSSLPNLEPLDDKLLKHCAHKGNMVFPRNYAPGKIAVLECEDNARVLVASNLYIIDINTEKVDPYYVEAFFDSAIGRELLNRNRTGATIPIIGVNTLRDLPFPLVDMETQKKIANKYLAAMDEIEIYRDKLEQAKERLTNAFEEGGDCLA